MLKRIVIALLALLVLAGLGLYAMGRGALGSYEGPGGVTAVAGGARAQGMVVPDLRGLSASGLTRAGEPEAVRLAADGWL